MSVKSNVNSAGENDIPLERLGAIRPRATARRMASVSDMNLLGGWLCLDFANTLDGRESQADVEYLTGYADLIAWSLRVETLTAREADDLLAAAQRDPQAAQRAFAEALRLRDIIYAVFAAIARQRPVAQADLDALSVAVADALAHGRLCQADDHVAWRWPDDAATLERPLWPIAHSAAELLMAAALRWVRWCPGQNCGWLFIDATKNHSRRWCSMETCGNRAKARRHYHTRTGADAT